MEVRILVARRVSTWFAHKVNEVDKIHGYSVKDVIDAKAMLTTDKFVEVVMYFYPLAITYARTPFNAVALEYMKFIHRDYKDLLQLLYDQIKMEKLQPQLPPAVDPDLPQLVSADNVSDEEISP